MRDAAKNPLFLSDFFSVCRMKLFTHFSVIKTNFSYKVNLSRYIEIHEEIGKPFMLTINGFCLDFSYFSAEMRTGRPADAAFRRTMERDLFYRSGSFGLRMC